MQRCGGNLSVYYWVKDANLKWLHTVDSNYGLWKRENYGVSKKISGVQGSERREGWMGRAQRMFRAVKVLCDTVMMDTYHCLKPVDYSTPRMRHNAVYGLQLIMICQCWFITDNECITLVGGCWWWGRGCVFGKRSSVGSLCTFPSIFVVNFQLV